eukprot:2463945-Karenia_brevis.AAC.1
MKGPAPWAEFSIGSNGTGDPQSNADLKARPWHTLWKVSSDYDISWPRGVDLPPDIPMPDVDEARSLSRRFSVHTAIGVDWIHPRHLGLLDDGTLDALLALGRLLLCLGLMPDDLDLLLIALIPKRAGGDRPIGIFPSIIRLLSKLMR